MKLEWQVTDDHDRHFANVPGGQLIISENKFYNWQIDCFTLPQHMQASWFFKHAIGCQFRSAEAAKECLGDWYNSTAAQGEKENIRD